MFSDREKERYARQFALPQFGPEGQLRLRQTSVLVIGAGGLGAPMALYLAAAGIGRLALIDGDRIDRTNLHRQVLYTEEDLGASKAKRARERLKQLNPDIEIEIYDEPLTSQNALELFRRFDIVADGSDNFPTRYLANDAAVLTGTPLVYGSVFRFEGQVTVLNHDGGPCYRCLFPVPPAPGEVPDCAEGGVLGALPGIIGSLQALEVVKLAAAIGEPLRGRLLVYDGLAASARTLTFLRDRACPVCGDDPAIHELIDYEAFCGVAPLAIPEIDATALAERFEVGDEPFLLDVREPFERSISSIGGLLIPLGEIEERLDELPVDRDIVVICRTGRRSADAVSRLHERGFGRAFNLRGGLKAWRERVDPALADY